MKGRKSEKLGTGWPDNFRTTKGGGVERETVMARMVISTVN